MITGFNHTSFTVTNMDRAVKFWTEALGFEARSVGLRSGDWQGSVTGVPGAALKIAHLFGHGAHIELIQYVSGAGPALRIDPNMSCATHICLEVSDIEEIWSRLVKAGASPQGRITPINNGPSKGIKAGYLRDPEGIIVELVEMPAA